MGSLKDIANGLLDLVYPPCLYCICCGKIIDDTRTYRLCNDCMPMIRWNTGRHCSKCGRPLSDNDPGETCFSCTVRRSSGQPRSFDKGHACAGYGACEQSMIFALKYGSRSDIGDTLGEMMYDCMTAEYGADELTDIYDLVIPVPTHMEKKCKRGYDHADLMAQSFAKRAGIRHAPDVVIRTRSTIPMKGLSPEARMANIRGAFAIRESCLPLIAGARILLIDDIFTTGATIDEIARILKEPDADDFDLYSLHGESTGKGGQNMRGYRPRHAARIPGASRVDFLAFAAAGDYLKV